MNIRHNKLDLRCLNYFVRSNIDKIENFLKVHVAVLRFHFSFTLILAYFISF